MIGCAVSASSKMDTANYLRVINGEPPPVNSISGSFKSVLPDEFYKKMCWNFLDPWAAAAVGNYTASKMSPTLCGIDIDRAIVEGCIRGYYAMTPICCDRLEGESSGRIWVIIRPWYKINDVVGFQMQIVDISPPRTKYFENYREITLNGKGEFTIHQENVSRDEAFKKYVSYIDKKAAPNKY